MQPHVVIIGGGYAGLCAAAALTRAGFYNFTIIEKAPSIGGTWHWNQYPGAACDIPSIFYSFSFARKYDWSSIFPPQAEIYQYLNDVAEELNLGDKLVLNTAVTSLTWDWATRLWTVSTQRSTANCSPQTSTITAHYVISATGQLSTPAVPSIPGKDSFCGPQWHSAQWPTHLTSPDQLSSFFKGKTVAVVGCAASAAQFIPPLVNSVGDSGKIVIFQRSASYVIPRSAFILYHTTLLKALGGGRYSRALPYWAVLAGVASGRNMPRRRLDRVGRPPLLSGTLHTAVEDSKVATWKGRQDVKVGRCRGVGSSVCRALNSGRSLIGRLVGGVLSAAKFVCGAVVHPIVAVQGLLAFSAAFLLDVYRVVVYVSLDTRILLFGSSPDHPLLRSFAKVMKAHLLSTVRDPAKQAVLTPTSAFGCKRTLITDDFYEALASPVVTVSPHPICRMDPRGVTFDSGAVYDSNGVYHRLDKPSVDDVEDSSGPLGLPTGPKALRKFAFRDPRGPPGDWSAEQRAAAAQWASAINMAESVAVTYGKDPSMRPQREVEWEQAESTARSLGKATLWGGSNADDSEGTQHVYGGLSCEPVYGETVPTSPLAPSPGVVSLSSEDGASYASTSRGCGAVGRAVSPPAPPAPSTSTDPSNPAPHAVSSKFPHVRLPADVIIWGTGFKAQEFLHGVTVRVEGTHPSLAGGTPPCGCGRGGSTAGSGNVDGDPGSAGPANAFDLHSMWRDAGGASAFNGILPRRVPNFFFMYGPNTNLGHSSIVFMLECQAAYAASIIRQCEYRRSGSPPKQESGGAGGVKGGGPAVVVCEAAAARQDRKLQAELQRTPWAGSCNSWYTNGAGRVVSNWHASAYRYWLWLRKVRRGDVHFVDGVGEA